MPSLDTSVVRPHRLRFTVPGQPRPYERPGVAVVGGFAKLYTPKATRDYMHTVGVHALAAVVAQRWTVPPKGTLFGLSMCVYRATAHRCDLDNVVKVISDAVTHTGRVWYDDADVATIVAQRAMSREAPRVEVEVVVLGGGG